MHGSLARCRNGHLLLLLLSFQPDRTLLSARVRGQGELWLRCNVKNRKSSSHSSPFTESDATDSNKKKTERDEKTNAENS